MYQFITFLRMVALAMTFLVGNSLMALTDEQEKASLLVANNWIKLVDERRYADSWSQASPVFQMTIPQKEWVSYLDSIRKPLGAVKARTVADQRPAMNPVGLAAGDYMVIVYDTTFTNSSHADELLTLSLGNDGKWRVLTYLISMQPASTSTSPK